MEFDDTEDKLRRNLVVVSTAIILITFLRVPIAGEAIWIFNLTKVEAWRMWTAAMLILGYCALRFQFAPQLKTQRAEQYALYRNELEKQKIKFLENTISGRESGWPSYIQMEYASHAAGPNETESIQFSADEDYPSQFWNGNVTKSWIGYLYNTDSTPPPRSGTYRIPLFRRWSIRYQAIKRLDWLNWTVLEQAMPYILEQAMPYILATCASIICLYLIYHDLSAAVPPSMPDLMPFMCGIFEL